MKKTTLIRYGELALKSKKVRARFERRLVSNIKSALGALGKHAKPEIRVRSTYGRIMAEGNADYDKLNHVFGIISFSGCVVTDAKMNNILDLGLLAAKETIRKNQAFAVKTNRVGKHEFTSEQVNRKLGALIVRELGNKVNLTKPDKTIFIDVRDKKAYAYTEIIKGPGGMPVGTQGRVAVLMEGKNSIAAAWIALKRGCEIVPVFAGKSNKKWIEFLKEWSHGCDLKSYAVKKPQTGQINTLIKKLNLLGLVTAEQLGDAKSFRETKEAVSVPVYRPLIGLSDADIKSILEYMKLNKPPTN